MQLSNHQGRFTLFTLYIKPQGKCILQGTKDQECGWPTETAIRACQDQYNKNVNKHSACRKCKHIEKW